MTFDNFKNIHKQAKYFGQKCYIVGCNEMAEYEGGDARFYCGVCEKHSNILEEWNNIQRKKIRQRKSLFPNLKYQNFTF